MFRLQRIKPADTREVNHRHGPDIGGFLDDFDVVIYEQAERVGIILRLLDVIRSAIEISPMDRCQKNDLLGGLR